MIGILAVLLTVSQPSPLIDCNTVRAMVAEHGRAKAIIWARSHGYSWTEINEAWKCLKPL